MTSTNPFEAWVTEQLDNGGYVPSAGADQQMIRTSVLALARVFGEMNFEAADPTGSHNIRSSVLELFVRFTQGHALPPRGDGIWRLARHIHPGIGMEVRVLSDSFTGDTGLLLNGRHGYITHGRNGIGVRFDDGRLPIDHVFKPTEIEVRVG